MTDLTEAQKAYNVAQSEMFQLAAYGHHRYHPSGECLTDEGKRQQRDYLDRIQAAREELEAAVLRLVADHAERYRTLPKPVVGWLRTLADDPAELSLLAVRPEEREEVQGEQPAVEMDVHESTTGHLATCLAVSGGEADPECPCQAEHPWIYRVTALRGNGAPPESKYLPGPGQARFWRDEVGALGYKINVGRVPAEAFQALSVEELNRLADEEQAQARQQENS